MRPAVPPASKWVPSGVAFFAFFSALLMVVCVCVCVLKEWQLQQRWQGTWGDWKRVVLLSKQL